MKRFVAAIALAFAALTGPAMTSPAGASPTDVGILGEIICVGVPPHMICI